LIENTNTLDFLHNPKRGSEIAFVGYGKIWTIAKNETDGF
jgi:hypothetical protein